MWPLLVIWAVCWFVAGWFLRSNWGDLFGDPYRQLAAADRRRVESLRKRHEDEQAFLMAEIHGDGSGW